MAGLLTFIILLVATMSIQSAYAQSMEGMSGTGKEISGVESMPEMGEEWTQQSMAFADILGMLDVFMGQIGAMKSVEMEDSFWDEDWMDEMETETENRTETMKMKEMKKKNEKEMESMTDEEMTEEESQMELEEMSIMGDGMM